MTNSRDGDFDAILAEATGRNPDDPGAIAGPHGARPVQGARDERNHNNNGDDDDHDHDHDHDIDGAAAAEHADPGSPDAHNTDPNSRDARRVQPGSPDAHNTDPNSRDAHQVHPDSRDAHDWRFATPRRSDDEHDDADSRRRNSLTGLDRLHDRIAALPYGERILRWIGPILVVFVAAGTRLWNLGSPHSLVFDETFYVKDAYTLLKNGYESSWPAQANDSFNAGHPNVWNTDPSFVVHPPLGKWIISLGFTAFGGAEDPASWRIATAVVGILAVILLMAIAWYLFRSPLVATIAGLLMAIDGNAIVMSRVALLDNSVMFFALLGFGAVLLDRQWSSVRLAVWIARRQDARRSIDWGPALWWRPWLIAAGVAFGAASAVKWNGIYFLAALAIYTLVVDAVARKHAGIPFWISSTIFKQGPVSFLLTVPVALATYLVSWTGWFATKGGYDRTWADNPVNAWKGAFAWVPHSLQSFIKFEQEVYNYNIHEQSPHPYAANPLTWLFMIRPTSMYFQGSNYGTNGCGVSFCGESITGIANPLIWYAGVAAALYLVYRLVRFREWRVGLILAGLAAGYLPWLLYLGRTVYQFYTIAFEPYLILALVFVISQLLGARGDPPYPRERGARLVAVFLALAVVISVFFWPLWTGMQVDFNFIRLHYWIDSWR